MKVKSVGALGVKLGMTQIVDSSGSVCGVTVIDFSGMAILGYRTFERDGYLAVILGYSRLRSDKYKHICEIKVDDLSLYKDMNFLEKLQDIEKVDVTSISKGKGFQGAMKRWNFGGGPASHGSKTHRRVGSIGQCTFPARVMKGKKMPGRMGGVRVTILSQRLLKVDLDRKIVFIEGSIPGANNSCVVLREAIKG